MVVRDSDSGLRPVDDSLTTLKKFFLVRSHRSAVRLWRVQLDYPPAMTGSSRGYLFHLRRKRPLSGIEASQEEIIP